MATEPARQSASPPIRNRDASVFLHSLVCMATMGMTEANRGDRRALELQIRRYAFLLFGVDLLLPSTLTDLASLLYPSESVFLVGLAAMAVVVAPCAT